MINTYQTSLAPPPVPPRLSRGHPILIPEPLAPRRHGKSHLRLLAGVVTLHFFLTIAGFIYLYNNEKTEKRLPEVRGKDFYSSENQATFKKIMAHMIVEHWRPTGQKTPTPGYLEWNSKNSVLNGIGRHNWTLLTVEQTGDYYVYSRVTFSTPGAQSPLSSEVMLRKDNSDKEAKTVMKSYCNPGKGGTMCTTSQGDLMTLERGNQLGVWVEDLSLVNYGKAATTFGMYKL